jgi:bifunctional DNA-binding transcriptional regulator/antitoxin component of YhaV-PrlF toxin-antitoxin module
MTYRTILTIKGTTTIPKEMRDQLGVKPGMLIAFTKNELTGEYTVSRAQTIDEVRQANKQALKKAGTGNKQYYGGAGYETHVIKSL